MKTKIATALKTKYQRYGLSNEAIDRIASAKEKTITSEDAIESGIADFETMELIAQEVQKQRDKEIKNKTDLQTAFDTYKTAHQEKTDPDPKNPPADPNEPEWARRLREQNEKVLEENRKIQDEFTRRDAQQKQLLSETNVKAALEKAGCTNPGILRLTMKGFALGENETEEQAVIRLTADYNQNVKDAFGDGNIPPVGVGVPSEDPHRQAEKMNASLEKKGLIPAKE